MLKTLYNRCNKARVWALFGILSFVVISEIVLTVLIPEWRNAFYNILEKKQESAFFENLVYFFLLMGGLGAVQGTKTWIGQLLSFEFRKSGSKLLLKSWVNTDLKASNYSQAQTEALRNSTELYLEIVVEVVISAAIVVALILANFHNMPIVIAALIYTAAATILAVLFNKPLITSDVNWQQAEGSYREAIGDIANDRGDFTSKEKFLNLISAYYRYTKVVMWYRLFSQFKGSLTSIVPYLILAAPYFAGSITLGVFMAGVATFELIVINATILTVLYPKLTKARASQQIVNNFFKEVRNDNNT